MIFTNTKDISISARETITSTDGKDQYNIIEINQINITKDLIPSIFYTQQYIDYSGNKISHVNINLNNRISIVFQNVHEAQFWFQIFNTDFENLTIQDIKEKYPENFI